MNKTQAPLQLLAGGYIGTFNVTSGSGGSRLQRRNIPRVCGIGARWALAVNAATFLTTYGPAACPGARS
jgi:hypothetical protein